MFDNTLTLTIDGEAKTLKRLNQDNFGSVYRMASGTEIVRMQIRNSVEKNALADIERHNVFIEHTVFATPTTPELYSSFSATLRGRIGTDPTKVGNLATGAIALLGTIQSGLIQGES